ncbi:MAG: retroviral-like aspartic protease family protein [Candidatus Cybelea sp.]
MRWTAAIIAAIFAFALASPHAAAGGQYAATTLTAPAIFTLNRHATGAPEPGTYHVVTQTVSQTGDAWTAETYRSGRNFRTTQRQGSFVTAYGSYDGRPWSEDSNGWITHASNDFEETDPFVASLRNAASESSRVKVLGLTSDGTPQVVVEVTPEDGLTERRFYDAQTHLLDRIEMVDFDGHKQIWNYSNYRSAYGLTLAHLIEYERDGTSVTRRTTLLSYEHTTAAPSLAPPDSRRLFDPGGRDSVTIPAKFTDGGIIVPVSIGTRTLDFLLDSGSSDLLIDPGVAGELGMRSSGAEQYSFAGDFTLANARAQSVSVGGLTAANVAFSTARFEEQLTDSRVVGLLGADFFASGVVEVDFEKKRLTMLRALPAGLAAAGWSPIPIRLDSEVPMVKAIFSGQSGHFIADLGAAYTTLFPHFFARYPGLIPKDVRDEEEMQTIGGKPFGITHLTMKTLVLGDWAFANVQVVVPSAAYAQQRDFDGLIGREILSSFDWIFDYADAQLWFKPIDQNTR